MCHNRNASLHNSALLINSNGILLGRWNLELSLLISWIEMSLQKFYVVETLCSVNSTNSCKLKPFTSKFTTFAPMPPMKQTGIIYHFEATPWRYAGPGCWCFVFVPMDVALEIRAMLKAEHEGWGRLKDRAKVGRTEWETSIWYDTKLKTYLLPLKTEIRKKEAVEIGKVVHVSIRV
jgi:Domain of unknown function (DUF1905)